jgi:site-specific DNA recombinase
MKTVAYIRVSTERQGEEGNGLEQQRRSICAYAAATGVTIDEWVADEATGTTEDREGIQGILSRSDVSKVVIDRVDRLGRTLLVSEALFGALRARGVHVVAVQAQIDDPSPAGVMVRQMMAMIAEYQRAEMLARLAQCKKAAKAKKGTYGGGAVAYGYVSVGGGKLAVDVATRDLVLRAHQLRGTGLSYRQVTEQLTKEGFRTRKGTELHPYQVERICKRTAVYTAQANFGSVPLDVGVFPQHPAILRKDN